MVEAVARHPRAHAEITQKTFDAIHTLVKNARLAIDDHDLRAIGQLLDLNQMLLSGLFLSTPEIEQMCATARGRGRPRCEAHRCRRRRMRRRARRRRGARRRHVLAAWKAEGFDGFAATVKAEVQDVREILQKLHERVLAAGSP